jgi:hypothetical protein
MKEVSGKKFEKDCRGCPQLLRFEAAAEAKTEKTLSAKIECRVDKCTKEVQ